MDGNSLPITVTKLQHLVKFVKLVDRKTILQESVDPNRQVMKQQQRTKTPNEAVINIEEDKAQLEKTTDVNLVQASDVNSSYTHSDEDYITSK